MCGLTPCGDEQRAESLFELPTRYENYENCVRCATRRAASETVDLDECRARVFSESRAARTKHTVTVNTTTLAKAQWLAPRAHTDKTTGGESGAAGSTPAASRLRAEPTRRVGSPSRPSYRAPGGGRLWRMGSARSSGASGSLSVVFIFECAAPFCWSPVAVSRWGAFRTRHVFFFLLYLASRRCSSGTLCIASDSVFHVALAHGDFLHCAAR